MVQEHLAANLLRDHIKLRYRDEILLIFPRILAKENIRKKHEKLNKIYGPELQVELEQISYISINFLEYVIMNNLETYHLNKNNTTNQNKTIIRYPPRNAEYPRHIFIGTIIGTIKRAINRSFTLQNKIYSCTQTIIEFIRLNYKCSSQQKSA